MATSDKHAGCIGFMANSYVRRPCCCFWGFLVFYVLVAFLGAAALLRRAQSAGQTSVFSDGTSYGARACAAFSNIKIVQRSRRIGSVLLPNTSDFFLMRLCAVRACASLEYRLERVGQAMCDEWRHGQNGAGRRQRRR